MLYQKSLSGVSGSDFDERRFFKDLTGAIKKQSMKSPLKTGEIIK
jgi:hypothetical protein